MYLKHACPTHRKYKMQNEQRRPIFHETVPDASVPPADNIPMVNPLQGKIAFTMNRGIQHPGTGSRRAPAIHPLSCRSVMA